MYKNCTDSIELSFIVRKVQKFLGNHTEDSHILFLKNVNNFDNFRNYLIQLLKPKIFVFLLFMIIFFAILSVPAFIFKLWSNDSKKIRKHQISFRITRIIFILALLFFGFITYEYSQVGLSVMKLIRELPIKMENTLENTHKDYLQILDRIITINESIIEILNQYENRFSNILIDLKNSYLIAISSNYRTDLVKSKLDFISTEELEIKNLSYILTENYRANVLASDAEEKVNDYLENCKKIREILLNIQYLKGNESMTIAFNLLESLHNDSILISKLIIHNHKRYSKWMTFCKSLKNYVKTINKTDRLDIMLDTMIEQITNHSEFILNVKCFINDTESLKENQSKSTKLIIEKIKSFNIEYFFEKIRQNINYFKGKIKLPILPDLPISIDGILFIILTPSFLNFICLIFFLIGFFRSNTALRKYKSQRRKNIRITTAVNTLEITAIILHAFLLIWLFVSLLIYIISFCLSTICESITTKAFISAFLNDQVWSENKIAWFNSKINDPERRSLLKIIYVLDNCNNYSTLYKTIDIGNTFNDLENISLFQKHESIEHEKLELNLFDILKIKNYQNSINSIEILNEDIQFDYISEMKYIIIMLIEKNTKEKLIELIASLPKDEISNDIYLILNNTVDNIINITEQNFNDLIQIENNIEMIVEKLFIIKNEIKNFIEKSYVMTEELEAIWRTENKNFLNAIKQNITNYKAILKTFITNKLQESITKCNFLTENYFRISCYICNQTLSIIQTVWILLIAMCLFGIGVSSIAFDISSYLRGEYR